MGKGEERTGAVNYQVLITALALRMLKCISDRRVRQKIRERIDSLIVEPQLQGKALMEELAGYRSLRAAGQRYRIIYRVQENRARVLVVAVGIRKEGSKVDIYGLARKLIRQHLVS